MSFADHPPPRSLPDSPSRMQYRVVDGQLQFKVGELSGVLPREASLTLARAILDWKSPVQELG
jgi:hypothetical protein